jgi:hypothetical protein
MKCFLQFKIFISMSGTFSFPELLEQLPLGRHLDRHLPGSHPLPVDHRLPPHHVHPQESSMHESVLHKWRHTFESDVGNKIKI